VSRALKLTVGGVLLAVAAFVAVYLLFFSSDSPDEFELTPTDDAAATTAPAETIDGTWTVASGSEAGYRVREKLANLPAQSDAVGRTSAVTGTVVIDGTSVTAASFSVDVTTLESDEARRDNRIRTSGLETDTFPTSTFELGSPIDLGADPGATVSVAAEGDLAIHGVTRRVTIPIEAARRGDQIELVGAITFPMADFEIEPPSIGGFVTVEDDATMEFKLLLARA
jgi:polyisoprenoid-binding protein YceI